MRIHEMAKKLGIDNKELIAMLNKAGFADVKSANSGITEEMVKAINIKYVNQTKTDTITKVEEPKKVEEVKKTEEAKKTEEPKKVEPPKKTVQQPRTNTQAPRNNTQAPRNNTQQQRNNSQGPKNNFQPKNNNNGNKKNPVNNTKQATTQNITTQAVVEVELEEVDKIVTMGNTISIKEICDQMGIKSSVLIKKLFLLGQMVNINTDLDMDEATEIALDYEYLVEREIEQDILEMLLVEEEDNEKDLVHRAPVVVVMGHVDHGKTSLLDAIRNTKVTTGEAGGITQHIGASVIVSGGNNITFLDTPGHEAFTAMRMRGAMATDIAILVVAADDGVMPQTVEAINHAKAAGVDIIIAINKIDKPSANVDRVKQELVEYGLVSEDWGGDTIFVPVSAITGENIDQLLEMVLLVAEVKELKANPKRNSKGIIIEARLDKGRGPVATVLVQAGTLRVGDPIVVGSAHGKIRAMMDDKGRRVKEAGPSTPVEILGLNEVPLAGDIFNVTPNDKLARTIAEAFISRGRERLLDDTKAKLSLDGLFSQIQAGNVKELNIVVKADVQGSVEAVKQSLAKLSNEEVVVRIIHGGVGAVNESDVMLASASNAIIIAFNVRPDVTAKGIADKEKVDLRLYRVIYNAIEDIAAAMKGLLDPKYKEKIIGHAEIRQTFKVSGVGTIAGGYVLDGKLVRNSSVRALRDNIVVYEGALSSLKRFKDDAKEVNAGYECGFTLDKYNDLKEGDTIEAFIMEEIPR